MDDDGDGNFKFSWQAEQLFNPNSLGPVSLVTVICEDGGLCQGNDSFCPFLSFFVILALKNSVPGSNKVIKPLQRVLPLCIYEYNSPIKKVAVNDAYNQYTSCDSSRNT